MGSHTEAFQAFHAGRQAARSAEAQAKAEARALADADRLTQMDGPQGPAIPNTRAILSPMRQTTAKEAEMSTTKTSTTKTLAREDSERVSIGALKPGQDYFRLSGKLKHQGTVVAVRPGSSKGYDLVYLTPAGEQKTTWGGAATMFYVQKAQPVQAEATTDGAEPQEGDAKAMASKTSTTQTPEATPEVPQVDLHKELVAQLKEAGLKVTPKWSPTKKYAAYKQADGKTLAYVFSQTSSGIKVKAGLEMKELARADKKHWLDNSKEAPFSIRGFFTLDTLGQAVQAIQATAAKLEAAKAAKAEAKKAPAKKASTKTKKEQASQPAPEASEAPEEVQV